VKIPQSGRVRLLLGGALALVSVLAAGMLFARCPLSAPPVSVAVVERGRFVREVFALGELQAVRATPIVAPTDVRRPQTIAELVADGSHVEKGQPVVVFDASSAEKELADGQADRQTAENKISKTRAEGKKTRQELTLDRQRASEDRERAEDVAPTEEGIFSRHQIIESKVDRALLDKKVAITTRKLETSSSLNQADLSLGLIERGKADIKIRRAEAALESLRVVAPHDGLLLLARGRGEVVSVGQQVWPGQKIAEIPDLSELEARVHVLEADAGGLAAGRTARIAVEGKPGSAYAAHVARVDALAKPRERRSPVRYFEVILAFDHKEQGAALKLGQKVRARIVLEEIDDVLTVPRGALVDRDGHRVVYRMKGTRFHPVEVEVGALSAGRAVIKAGLASGDRVALRDPTRSLAEILRSREGAVGPSGTEENR
jgi:RND family efflux transporter MFP subunit